jgi:hypothetical protein
VSRDPKRVRVLESYCQLATRNKLSVERAMQTFSEMLDKDQDYLPAVLGMATGFMIEKNQVHDYETAFVVFRSITSRFKSLHHSTTKSATKCAAKSDLLTPYFLAPAAQGAQPAEARGQDGGQPARRRGLREGQPAARQVLHRQGETPRLEALTDVLD